MTEKEKFLAWLSTRAYVPLHFRRLMEQRVFSESEIALIRRHVENTYRPKKNVRDRGH